MAQDQAQSLLLTQSSFVVAGPRNVEPNIPHPRHSMVSPDVRPRDHFSSIDDTRDYRMVEYRVVNSDELLDLFSDPKPSRVDVGVLPNGMAYAPVAREQFLLFPSKSDFILYFTHYYFSNENLSKDRTFLSKMINGYMPLATLVQAPRLRAIEATEDEVAEALAHSKIVCVEDLGDGVRGVCRRDRGLVPFAMAPEESWSQFPSTGSFTPSFVAPAYLPTKPYSPPICSVDSVSERPSVEVTNQAAISYTNTTQPPEYTMVPGPSQSLRSSSEHMASTTSLPVDTADTMIGAPNFSPDTRTGTWANQQAGVSSASFVCQLPGSQQSLVIDSSPLLLNSPFPVTPAPCTGPSLGNFHTQYDIPLVSIRQPAALGHYLLNSNGSYVFGNYPVTSTGVPASFAVAAGAYHNPPHLASNAAINGAFLGALNPNAHSAALAAFAAAHQQPTYFQPSLVPNMQPSAHTLPANTNQTNIPFYYMNQPFHFSPHLSRHRFTHAPAYPIPTYPCQQALVPNTSHLPADLFGHLKAESHGFAHGGASCTTSGMYPIMFPHVHNHTTTGASYNLGSIDARLALAATGLNIQRNFPNPRYPSMCTSSGINNASIVTDSVASVDHFATPKCESPSIPADASVELGSRPSSKPKQPFVNENVLRTDAVKSDSMRSLTKGLRVALNDVYAVEPSESNVKGEKVAHHSSADSEDSTSSGIGEMNSVCSSSAGDARTLSSFTLTDQQAARTDISTSKNREQSVRSDTV